MWLFARVVHHGGVGGVDQEDRRVVPWVESFWSNPIILLGLLHQRLYKSLLIRMTDTDGLCLQLACYWRNLLEEPSVDKAIAEALGGRVGKALAHSLVQTLLAAKPLKKETISIFKCWRFKHVNVTKAM